MTLDESLSLSGPQIPQPKDRGWWDDYRFEATEDSPRGRLEHNGAVTNRQGNKHN